MTEVSVKNTYLKFCWNLPGANELSYDEAEWHIYTGTGYEFFSLIFDSSVYLWVGIQSAGDFGVSDFQGSNPAFSRGRQLVSFQLKNHVYVPEH